MLSLVAPTLAFCSNIPVFSVSITERLIIFINVQNLHTTLALCYRHIWNWLGELKDLFSMIILLFLTVLINFVSI